MCILRTTYIHHHPSIEFIFVLSAEKTKNFHYNTHGILYSLHGVKKSGTFGWLRGVAVVVNFET